MLKACVIGNPVKHSLSPIIHGHWLDKHGINGEYTAVEVAESGLAGFVAQAKTELTGFNITLPHKENIMGFCDELTDTAKSVGAVNTVYIKDGIVYGDNTDVYGVAECFKQHTQNINVDKSHAMIVGAGGASRACVVAFKKMGFEKITIVNRTPKKARDLAEEFSDNNITINHMALDDINDNLHNVSVLINSSAAGLDGKNPLQINFENAQKNNIVYDIVYQPLNTPLLQMADEYGLHTIGGIDMLLYQAVSGFNYFFGVQPTVDDELRNKVIK